MRTTISLPENLVKEIEAVFKADSRSKSIEYALRDALKMYKLRQLESLIGKIEFDEEAVKELRHLES